MTILARWLVSALMFLVVANFVPGIHVEGFLTALLLAMLWSVITMVLKPILLILTLPVNMLTFGLFTLVINGFLFWFLARIVPGFEIASFGVAILGALALSLLHMVVQLAFREKND